MSGMAAAGIGLLVQRFDPHLPHQRGDMLAANLMALSLEHVAQHTAAGKRMFEVQRVDAAHQHQIWVNFVLLRYLGQRLVTA